MRNNKGMTVTEVIMSIVLISIILLFLIGLFINVRGDYNSSKQKAEYEVLKSNIIKSVGDDIEKYGIYSITKQENNSDGSCFKLLIVYNAYRETEVNERIKKELTTEKRNGKVYLSYKFFSDESDSLTSRELMLNMVREIPSYNDRLKIYVEKLVSNKYVKINIPIKDNLYNSYDINIYGEYLDKVE